MAIDPNILLKAQPVDVGGAIAEGDQANLIGIKAQQARTELAEQQQDQAALKDYSQIPEADLFTSEGLKKAQDHLKGRVSPKTYMQLADRYQKVQQGEMAYKMNVAKMNDTQLQNEKEENEFIVQHLGDVVKEKDPVKRQQALDAAIQTVSTMTKPDGTPRIDPKHLAQLRTVPPQVLDSLYANSEFKKREVDLAHKQAQSRKLEADAKIAEEGGKATMHIDTADNQPVRVFQNGTAQKQNPNTGEWTTTPMPATLRTADVKQGSGADKTKAAQELMDFVKNPPTPAEQEMARVYRVTRKMESLGQNSPLRPRIAMLAAQQSIEEGRNVLGDNATYKAESSNVANLTKQYGVIKAGEQTVLNNLELMKPLINKVDETGVPAVERWIRAGKRAVQGDADVTALNVLIVSTQADIGKVLSASTGAAGVPVAALQEAKKYMDGNLTKSQFDSLYDIVPKEMTARTAAIEGQISGSINKINRLTGRPESTKSSASTSRAWEGAKPTSLESTPEEKDKVRVYTEALADAKRKYQDAKTPEEKTRAAKDRDGIIEEMRKAKIEVPADGGAAKVERAMSKSGKPMIKVDGTWVYE